MKAARTRNDGIESIGWSSSSNCDFSPEALSRCRDRLSSRVFAFWETVAMVLKLNTCKGSEGNCTVQAVYFLSYNFYVYQIYITNGFRGF